jgi:hypothetical protein
VFVVGDELVPTASIVRECLEYQRWTTSTGEVLDANRFVFPNAPHFDAVSALICVELVENGLHGDAQAAFLRTEPVLSLALRRATLGDEALLGLAGELMMLQAITRAAAPSASPDLVYAWTGSAPSTRDFQIGTVGVEVKTTTGATSEHYIHGLHQVELGSSVDGVQETSLFLMSLGLRWLDDAGGGYSIPDLVDAVLSRLPDEATARTFLARVRQYGGDVALGYDHTEHRDVPRFRRRFELRFERLYDMADESIRVLRSVDLDGRDHVEPKSVNYRLRLPPQVRGDVNPVTGLHSIVERILSLAQVPLAKATQP